MARDAQTQILPHSLLLALVQLPPLMNFNVPAASQNPTPHSSSQVALNEQTFFFFLGLRAPLPPFMCPKNETTEPCGYDSDKNQDLQNEGT